MYINKKEVHCKDCKFASEKSLGNRLLFGFKYAKCTRTAKPDNSPEYELVTGKPNKPTTKVEYCASERRGLGEDKCGAEGKFWVPKHKKDFFTYLTRI